jgi:hypothetical protein
VKPDTLTNAIKNLAKKDEGSSAAETAEFLADEGVDTDDYIVSQVKAGELSEKEALKLLKEAYPDKDEDTLWWKVDRAAYKRDTGNDAGSGTYYRLHDAIAENKADKINSAVKLMMAHGVKAENIRKQLASSYKKEYLAATGSRKRQLKDALTKAYKATGLTEAEAIETINKWK